MHPTRVAQRGVGVVNQQSKSLKLDDSILVGVKQTHNKCKLHSEQPINTYRKKINISSIQNHQFSWTQKKNCQTFYLKLQEWLSLILMLKSNPRFLLLSFSRLTMTSTSSHTRSILKHINQLKLSKVMEVLELSGISLLAMVSKLYACNFYICPCSLSSTKEVFGDPNSLKNTLFISDIYSSW